MRNIDKEKERERDIRTPDLRRRLIHSRIGKLKNTPTENEIAREREREKPRPENEYHKERIMIKEKKIEECIFFSFIQDTRMQKQDN